ncbi:MAG: Ig-like domain-containing protein [Clostridia bacterium]|nr:Ig-like domain-containing protein [Clostridia bacterium]
MKKKLLLTFLVAVCSVCLALGFAGCGSVGFWNIEVQSVSLDKTTLTLFEGQSDTLTVTVEPADANVQNVEWSTSDESVVTVTSSGYVTGVSAGEAVVTVTTEDGGYSASCEITVSEVKVQAVTLSEKSLMMNVGGTETLTAAISPADAKNQNISWSSSSEAVATVSDGLVTAVSEGEAEITVTAEDGGLTAVCKVTVIIPVESVSLDKTALTLAVGDSGTLTATVLPADATDKSVVWTSSDEKVAVVFGTGTVSAYAAGTATITATTVNGEKVASCEVTVEAKTVSVSGVHLNKTAISLEEGESETLTVTVLPNSATDRSVSWSSSDETVVTVSEDGTVTAIAAGTATVTVTTTDGGHTATCTVTVSGTENAAEAEDL